MPLAAAQFDADRRLAAWNAAFAELGIFPRSLLKPGVAFAEFARRDPSLKRRSTGPHEIRLPDGRLAAVRRRSMRLAQTLVTYEDVTPTRLATERLDLVTRASNEGTYDWDIVNDTIYYSDQVFEAIGLRRKDVPDAEAWYARIHPEDQPRYSERLRAHFRGETDRFEVEVRFRGPKGTWRWARQHGIGVRDAQGRVVRMVGSTGDIDRLKRLEQALAESEARYALATRAATEGIYDWNVDTGELYLSDRAKTFFAIKGKKLTPAIWNSRIHPEDFPVYREAVRGFFKGEAQQLEQVYRIRDAVGGFAWITDRAVAVRDEGGRVARLVGAITDITARKQAELDLQRAHDETREALEHQMAIADLLQLINRTDFDVETVLNAIVSSAATLCNAEHAVFYRRVGDGLQPEAAVNVGEDYLAYRRRHPIPINSPNQVMGLVARTMKPVHVPDVLEMKDYAAPAAQKLGAFRTVLGVPLARDGALLGTLAIFRTQVRPFDERQISLMQTFADQAVIAIENARLFNETKEALERQTAISEILRVISASPGSVQPVLEAVAERAARICEAKVVDIVLAEGDVIRIGATYGELGRPFGKAIALDRDTVMGRSIVDRAPVNVADLQNAGGEFAAGQALARRYGHRAILAVPLLREGRALGTILVRRPEARPFEDKHVELLKTFADQAAIAIENARLFNQTREALERQTATAEILKVIAGSPDDVQPVFDAIAGSALRLIGGRSAVVVRRIDDALHLAALTLTDPSADEALRRSFPTPLTGKAPVGRAVLTGKPAFTHDIETDPAFSPDFREIMRSRGTRSVLVVPMLRDGAAIGAIGVALADPLVFTDHQIGLLQTFADQAVIAIENVRLFNETKEALERQTATTEILKVIARSPDDVQPVFDAIVVNAMRLMRGSTAHVTRREGDQLNLVAYSATNEAGVQALKYLYPIRIAGSPLEQVLSTGVPMVVADTEADSRVDDAVKTATRARRARSFVVQPLIVGGSPVGTLVVNRQQTGRFSKHELSLLRAFADQAAIAIENVRLFNETKEALERQTATAEILSAMSDSMTDAQPVFDAIVRNLRRLFDTRFAVVQLLHGDTIEMPAVDGEPGFERLRDYYPRPFDDATIGAQTMTARRVLQCSPVIDNPEAAAGTQAFAREFGFNAVMFGPMLRGDAVIGVIGIAHRDARVFDDKETELLKSFADQAVIAIENVRLFNETKEALERQTATADILKVISESPTDVQPVFEAIVRSAAQLFAPGDASIMMRDGGQIRLNAVSGPHMVSLDQARSLFPVPFDPATVPAARAMAERRIVEIFDTETPTEGWPEILEVSRTGKFRSATVVPLTKAGAGIGAIALTHPQPGFRMTDKQLALAQTFADQAVIAIENVRLFNETTEALERQTATAEILEVISSSPNDVQPVLDAVVSRAARICRSDDAVLFVLEGERFHQRARYRLSEAVPAPLGLGATTALDRTTILGAAVLDRAPVHIDDLQNPPPGLYEEGRRRAVEMNHRTTLAVPLLRENTPLGAILLRRREVHPFAEKQIALLRTFADQAAIGIENVRLFKELQERTAALTTSVGQLTALGEVGQAISSTLDVETVLKTIVSHALRLTGLDAGVIYEYDTAAERFQLRASENFDDDTVANLRGAELRVGEGAVGTSVAARKPTQVPDTHAPDYPARLRELLDRPGFRAVLAVPLLREEQIIGALMMLRRTPGPFPPEVVELLTTFGSQSALAIQNARLFREIEDKGRQLEVANKHKSDFLANMSHELRTPLNAVIGFSEVLIDRMFGELNEKQDEYLKDIHSSGKHLLSLINDILDLSKIEAGRMDLDLAEFDLPAALANAITLVRERATRHGVGLSLEVDPALGEIKADERKVKQIMLNLLSNAVKFTPDGGKVSVRARPQADAVEIAVTDTGVGIAAEDQQAVFEEFKQVGDDYTKKAEGTGLGLALTRSFVELHGGRLWLESERGKGSTFTFTLPRQAGESA